MKILSIRGENLTSLDGPFEVRLDQPPLSNAGLYAITGPTGAGKTTLLDTMCVALFGCTPRLSGRSDVKVGGDDEALSVKDVAHLLRRGADHGSAEVEFLGDDGRRYRSRWEIRRAARGKKLQHPVMILTDLETLTPIGRTLTETREAIVQKLGLAYDQFRRTVLLAQGEFAAFLNANAKDRAAALEGLTGYDIYRRVSKRAYEQKRDGAARVKAARGELDLERGSSRSEADHLLLVAERDTLAAERPARAEAVEAAIVGERWHVAQQEQEADREARRAERDAAEARLVALGPLREAVEAVEQVNQLRPLLLSLDQARKETERRQIDEGVARADREQRVRELEAQKGAAAAAQTMSDAAQQARKELEPRLVEARRLDTELAEARVRGNEARAVVDRLKAELDAVLTRRDTLRNSKINAEKALLIHDGWLNEHRELAPLALDAGALGVRLDLLQQQRATQADLQRRVVGARQEQAEADRGAADAGAVAERARAELQAVEARFLEANAASEARPVAEARAALEAARTQLRRLEHRAERLDRAREWREAQRAAIEEQRGQEAEVARAREEAQAQATLRADLLARREEAARHRQQVEAAAGLAGQRAALVEGEACPLCGATEHPWAVRSPLEGLVEEAQRRLIELENAERGALAASTAAAARAESLAAQARGAAERGAAAERTLIGVMQELGVEVSGLDGLIHETQAARALATTGLEQEEARVAAAEAARGALEAASTRRAESLAVLHRAEQEAGEARARAERRADQTRSLEDEQARVTAVVEAETAALSGPLGNREGWPRIDAAWVAKLRGELRGYSERAREREQAAGEVAALQPALAELARDAEARRAAAVTAEEALKERRDDYGRRLEERRKVLSGTADEAEQQAREAVERHGEAARRAAEQEASARARVEAAGTALAIASDAVRRQVEVEAERRVTLDSRRGTRSEEDLRRLLAHDEAWIQESRATLADAQEARVRAEQRLSDADARLQAHQERRPESLDLASARAGLELARKSLQGLDQRLTTLDVMLAEDEARRVRVGAQEARLAALELAQQRLDQLALLIGSADGNRFAEFAQGLTLHVLLGHANTHLADLNPRYLLQRVPNENMEIQVVDRYMADEIRPLTSLSGGETFLVSLALALGLSELVTGRTRVESVFIDEGFGALDTDALDVAIATLEALQGSGRQVGIISHVGGLAERIGAQVKVLPAGSDRSRVEVVAR